MKKEDEISANNGYCIRCHTKILFDIDKPYCYECFQVWKQFENPNYIDKYCHECGKDYNSILLKYLCEECYWKD